jgi:hypothetical protein
MNAQELPKKGGYFYGIYGNKKGKYTNTAILILDGISTMDVQHGQKI